MADLNEQMDKQLAERVAALHAGDDESGDGKINIADLQLDRVEAQLELQDKQNRALLRGQRVRLWMTVCFALVLAAAVAFLWYKVDEGYNSILQTSTQVNELAGRVQESMAELDSEELSQMMEDLPAITEKLSALDVDSLNEVLSRLPALMDLISDLQGRIEALQGALGGIGSGISNGLSSLFGG